MTEYVVVVLSATQPERQEQSGGIIEGFGISGPQALFFLKFSTPGFPAPCACAAETKVGCRVRIQFAGALGANERSQLQARFSG